MRSGAAAGRARPDPQPRPPNGRPQLGGLLGRSTAIMAAGTALSRLTGFGRLVALAYALGFTRLTDSYNLANVTPNIVYELVLGGILSATLVPLFVEELTTEDEDDAWRAISAVITAAAAVLVVVTALFLVAAPLLVRLYTLGNDTPSLDDQRAVATGLLRLFAPQVALYGMTFLVTAVLNARRRFAAPMFAPVLNNLVVISVLVAFPHVVDEVSLDAVRHDQGAQLLLGLGTTAGVAAMAVALLPSLRTAGARLRFVWDPGHPAVRTILRLSGWTFGFVAANQLALLVVLVLAGGRAGDVAAYQAGQVFFLLPHGIFAVSVMTALQPDLAERWAVGDVAGFGRRAAVGLRTIAVVVIPAAVGYLLLARPIVGVALEHGALRAGSASTTAGVLALLALGLPGFSTFLFVARSYQSMQDTRTLFFLYLWENGINVVLALVLYPSLGVHGLALSYSVAYTAAAAAGVVQLQRRTGSVDMPGVVQTWVRIAFASAVMAVVVAALSALPTPAVVKAGAGVAAGVTVYLAVASRLRIRELSAVLRTGRGLP